MKNKKAINVLSAVELQVNCFGLFTFRPRTRVTSVLSLKREMLKVSRRFFIFLFTSFASPHSLRLFSCSGPSDLPTPTSLLTRSLLSFPCVSIRNEAVFNRALSRPLGGFSPTYEASLGVLKTRFGVSSQCDVNPASCSRGNPVARGSLC